MTLRLNGATSGFTEIDAPAVAGSNTLVLPTGNGTSGQVLSTNGSGALSCVQGGRILQVVQTAKTDTFSTTTTGSYVDITGLSVSITPTSSSNKILVFFNTNVSASDVCSVQLLRGSTPIFNGDSGGGSRFQATVGGVAVVNGDKVAPVSAMYLDSPSTTSSITYKIQVRNLSGTVTVNKPLNDSDASYTARTASSITVMEVAA